MTNTTLMLGNKNNARAAFVYSHKYHQIYIYIFPAVCECPPFTTIKKH